MKTIRCAKAGEASFKLTKDSIIENDPDSAWIMSRQALKEALINEQTLVRVHLLQRKLKDRLLGPAFFRIDEGNTQRGKKFIQIGCKRFVGVNRRALIQWAKAAK